MNDQRNVNSRIETIIVHLNTDTQKDFFLLQVSFAGASLVTSYFLARRGKAFIGPGQDLDLAVNVVIVFKTYLSLTIFSLVTCWPASSDQLKSSPTRLRSAPLVLVAM